VRAAGSGRDFHFRCFRVPVLVSAAEMSAASKALPGAAANGVAVLRDLNAGRANVVGLRLVRVGAKDDLGFGTES